MITCCKNCKPPIRYPGCHSKCNKYLKEKAKWEEEKKTIRKKQDKERNYMIYPSDFKTLTYMHKPNDKRHR